VKSFFLEKRVAGKVKRITIGRFGELTAEQARKEAVKLAGQIATGSDPVTEKAQKKLEGLTLAEALDAYIERRQTLKERTVKDMRYAFDYGLSDWMKKPMLKISPDMVVKRHREMGEKSHARANLTMRYLRSVFSFAMDEYTGADGKPIIEVNPVKKLSTSRAWYRVDRRQTVIKPHELAAWWKAVDEQGNPTLRDYFQFVLLTGVRRKEAALLKWSEVDLQGRTFTVLDPKNHHDHTLPLSDFLLDMMIRRKAEALNEYVFTDQEGRRPANVQKAQERIDKASGVSFCIHDLRRTFATIAESLDIPGYALKRLLNHATGSDVTAGYIVASTERLRDPMQKITDFVLKATGVKASADVVSLQREMA
jgi:integrase